MGAKLSALQLTADADLFIAEPPAALLSDLEIDADQLASKMAQQSDLKEPDPFDIEVRLLHIVPKDDVTREYLQGYLNNGKLKLETTSSSEYGLQLFGDFFGFLRRSAKEDEPVAVASSSAQPHPPFLQGDNRYLRRDYISPSISSRYQEKFGSYAELDKDRGKLEAAFKARFQIPEGKSFHEIEQFEFHAPENNRTSYVVFTAAEGEGQTAFSNATELEYLLSLSLDSNIRFVRPQDKVALLKGLEHMRDSGRKFDFLNLSGHGNPQVLSINETTKQYLMADDFAVGSPLLKALDAVLKEDASVALEACSTGQLISQANLAEVIARNLNRLVFAAVDLLYNERMSLASPGRISFRESPFVDLSLVITSSHPYFSKISSSRFLKNPEFLDDFSRPTTRYLQISCADFSSEANRKITLENLDVVVGKNLSIETLFLANMRESDIKAALKSLLSAKKKVQNLRMEGMALEPENALALPGSYINFYSIVEKKFSASIMREGDLLGSDTLRYLDIKRVEREQHMSWSAFPRLQGVGIDADYFLYNPPSRPLEQVSLYGFRVDGGSLSSAEGVGADFKSYLEKAQDCQRIDFVFSEEDAPRLFALAEAQAKDLGMRARLSGHRIVVERMHTPSAPSSSSSH